MEVFCSVQYLVLWILVSLCARVQGGGLVTRISPTSGSVRGATRLTVFGQGFAENQFNFYQPELGNHVTLISTSGTHVVTCDVIPYYTTSRQIVCNTRPSNFGFGSYYIRVQVDGSLLRNDQGETYCGDECIFKYEDKTTPTITDISPRYGIPGTLLTLRGRIFTDQYIESDESTSDGPTILRLFAGSGLCELLDQGTKKPYGIALDKRAATTGYIKCKPSSSQVGSQRVSFIISGYGRSLLSNGVIQMDANNKLYVYQSHADITSISPSNGSVAGGTIVTITGTGFIVNATTVTIGGIPCSILSINAHIITCQISQEFVGLPSGEYYQGNRGLLREVWTSTKVSDLSSIANLDSSSRDYHSEVLPDASSPVKPSFGEKTMFSSRVRGFFVAPSDNNYTFYIQADDKAALYLSTNSSALCKTKIASCPSAASTWTTHPQQRSAVFNLKAGAAYFLEAYHSQVLGSSSLRIAVKIARTKYVNSKISSAVNEKQIINVTSTQHPDVQIINVTNWESGLKYEFQRVSITPNCNSSGACNGFFQLRYNDQKTTLLNVNSTADEVQSALNSLQPITEQGNVTVTQDSLNGTTNYNVTFVFALPEKTKTLTLASVTNGIRVTVTQVQKGLNGKWSFRFSLAQRISDFLRIDATSDDVKSALQSMLSWQCSYQIPLGRAWYYNGFEARAQGPEWGDRVVEETPFCGRTSLKNPTYIFRAGQSRDLGGRVLNAIDVSRYRQLCFAYKGAIKPYLTYLVSYTDQSDNARQVWRNYGFTPISTTKWYFQCIGIHDNVYGDSYFNNRANREYGFYVEGIKVARQDDVYIDDVFIWEDVVNVQRQSSTAKPGGHVIKSFDVKKLGSTAWAIYLTPAHCGTDIDKITIIDAEIVRINSSNDVTAYRPANQTNSSMVTVTRDQKATPPIGGIFDIFFQERNLSGLSSNISADDLKSSLQTNLDIGHVTVTRSGSCAGYQWTIEWSSVGGDQPDLRVDGSHLSGNDVIAKVETVDDGGMFLRPIPGDMLRVAERKPQVSVLVSGIPSSCSHRNCSFVFLSSATPSLTSITPNQGTAGDQLTLTGSDFSTQCSDISVMIGGRSCHVTRCTSTTIVCTAGQYEGGFNEVVVSDSSIGSAKHLNGQVSYKQEVTINDVTPKKGSIVGGTVLTVTGNGFTSNKSVINVSIGGTHCNIVNTSLSQITCITSNSGASTPPDDLTIRVRGQIGTLSACFRFDSSSDITPVIQSVGPSLTQSVGGGGYLEITSKSPWQRGTSVMIGSQPCNITQYYSKYIKCILPQIAPGKYDVKVHVPGKGYASYHGKIPQLESVLEVTDVFPLRGSVFGGTVVTIKGRGFSIQRENNVVKIGDVPCDVLSSKQDEILCKTREATSMYVIDNSAIHPEYGLGYAWNPNILTIHAGDTVKWKWSSPEMTNLKFGVQQTNDSSSMVYNGKGFQSNRSSNGWFQHRFNVPGHYYYISGPVDPYNIINMKGRIVVLGVPTRSAMVSVQIGNFTATYKQTNPLPPLPNTPNCHEGITSQAPLCNSVTQNKTSFVFSGCSTPEVTSISPNVGTSSTLLTIRGKGLGPKACYNKVLVGTQQCIVSSSKSDVITCSVAMGNGLTAGIPYKVTVRVHNHGYAWIKSNDVTSQTFTLLPTVTSLSPWAGSLAGGTLLTITGDGFSTSLNENRVYIGTARCDVSSSTATQIQCYTQAQDTPIAANVTVVVNNLTSTSNTKCLFTYSDVLTPRIDYVTPTTLIGSSNAINMYGSGFPIKKSDVTITIGNSPCDVISLTSYAIRCIIGPLAAGVCNISVRVHPKGRAFFDVDAVKSVTSLPLVSDVSPTDGSIFGGTTITITGNGFDPRPGGTSVRIGLKKCAIRHVTNSRITCVTTKHTTGSHEVQITSGNQVFPSLRYAYRTYLTPRVSNISPPNSTGGGTLIITGKGFGNDLSKVSVTIGNSTCLLQSLTSSKITCTLGGSPAGFYDVMVHVKGLGLAGPETSKLIKFTYDIKISSATPRESGFGGGRILAIQGLGFSNATLVTICDSPCHVISVTQSVLQCEVPHYQGRTDVTCSLSVFGPKNIKAFKTAYFTYRTWMTSRIARIDPPRGGTGGGTLVTISGSGFSSVAKENKVTIAGVKCKVTSSSTSQIQCTTGQRQGSILTKVRVEVGDKGIATQDHADFEYIDVWSSRFSWGGKNPPIRGDLVVIPRGQTMLLDTTTPVFAALVIKGKLKFDERDLVLNAEKILIVDGGVLEVGTEDQPFRHKARIVLHGSVRSAELPLFGAKVLAVREGTLDLHGKHVPITWTHLEKTAEIGTSQLTLKQPVTWDVGDDIILASTSRSPEENEQFSITNISSDGRTIGIKPPLKYKHLAIVQTIAGRVIESRAEVGLLTRNVVVEGSVQREWSDSIRECPEDFDPDEFATQTCFVGRYGDEINSDQFGSQIMLNAKEMNKGLVTGRISYVEVRHAGQAFKLGRYPIHFHMSGDVTGSYVRGCAIHHTFNRAVTIHGVQGLLVEHNVAYHVMGHAYFIEDGIETGNTIQYNLGVFVTSSSSLLNVDVTPGTFWITNPNNTVRHNAAAGGSHFGFWYNMPVHPGGPSYTPTVWPRTAPLGEFRNNSAHSFGRYGLWIFPTYTPSGKHSPAQFQYFTAYNNLKGFEVTEVSNIQCINCTMIDNKEAGFQVTIIQGGWSRSSSIRDSLVVGYSDISGNNPSYCTMGGVVGPHSSGLTLSGVTFVNFDDVKCAALRGCSFCRPYQGGWTVNVERVTFIHSPNKVAFQWQHETVYNDLDGTLTDHVGGSIVATNENLPPQHCNQSSSASHGRVGGSICNSIPQFRRLAWNDPRPTSLLYKDALLSNQYGTNHVPWASMRLTHKKGWMTTLILGENYTFTFENAQQLSNISYNARFYEFGPRDYVWITHPMKNAPDVIQTTDRAINMSSGIPQPNHASTGDWFYNNQTKTMTYIVTGETALQDQDISLQVIRCFYDNCIIPTPPPPPEKRPLKYLTWSDPESWYGTEQGYGGYNKNLPRDGDDVMIRPGWWMVADTSLPYIRKLIIYGTLELEPSMDFVLNATYIYVAPEGNLIMGWHDQPMEGRVVVSLQGDWDTPDMTLQGAPNMGAKALGVFGNLEIHGKNHTVYWTRLATTAEAGVNQLRVMDAVDWERGDVIVIAPTTYRPHETEVMEITSLSSDHKTIFINETLKYKHISSTNTIGPNNVTMAAEVGLLTRNIIIEGADDSNGVLGKQLFGCRVLIGSIKGYHGNMKRRIRIENVEFRHCGQEGWTDYYDPRYSLSFLDVPSLTSSYVRGNSFHHGYSTAIGVFAVNHLRIHDNVIHRTVGSAVRVQGTGNYLIHNLVVQSLSPATFNGRHELMNLLWHAAFEVNRADDITLQDNAAAGSERIGFHIRGENCFTADTKHSWHGNVAHTCLHGIHIGYNDGYYACAKVSNFVSWKNWDYGIFAYTRSVVIVEDCVMADNKAGVLINVYAPPALSHKTADKYVQLDNVTIIGTSPSFDCTVDNNKPINAFNTMKARGPRTKGGGHIGFVLTSFSSGTGLAPEFPWHMIETYPAINGVTRINSMWFSSFGTKCGRRSVAIMTNPLSPDAMHPTKIRGVHLRSMNKANLLYLEPPKVTWINPSDCVDMDCDGHKEVLIRDVDGSLTGVAGGSIISKAEYEWNGDPRHGLGDYRIPKAMLTAVDGTRLNASQVAPHHGIVRGTRAKSSCDWNTDWNAYTCKDMDYKMLVIESMDVDTEVRRLSPVALSADGYTNLLNGPQDHGWCHGYTCQERISTFYAIVATGRNYTMYFTGTNPEKLRLRLLNSISSQTLRLAIWYSKPQRLDVYQQGLYVYPTNAIFTSSGFTFKKKDPSLPDDQFEPTLSSVSGSNYFDNERKMLFVVVRGGVPVDIRTMPIVQITIGTKPVHINDFFEKNLISNLAALLNIDKSRIRVVRIISAAGRSRRRRDIPRALMKIKLEISYPPPKRIPYKPNEMFNHTGSPTNPPPTSAPYPDHTAYKQLKQLASTIVETAQTKKMSSALNLEVLSIDVVDPEPPRSDPTGGVRATNGTGGPYNGTWRYDQKMKWKEGNKTSLEHDFLIPAKLVVTQQPGDANETVAFGVQPKVVMLDAYNRTVTTLGHDQQWFVTASIQHDTGSRDSFLGGNVTISFIDGWANFTNLYITHSDKNYVLDFTVTSPRSANSSVASSTFHVKERILYFTLASSPREGNETVPFERQPTIVVRDAANGELVTNTGWKGRQWLCRAVLRNTSNTGSLQGLTAVQFSSGIAWFTNLSVDRAGGGYVLTVLAWTVPPSRYSYNINSKPFDVIARNIELVITQQPGDCNDTVICGSQPILELQDTATNKPLGNVGWRGKTWMVKLRTVNNATIIQYHVVPKSGRIIFTGVKFYNTANNVRLIFEVEIQPSSSPYSNMTVVSNSFAVQPRTFYLAILNQPGRANASAVFGQQPVIEVRDVGTRARATPLKTTWNVSVSMYFNPKPGQSVLKGAVLVPVFRERARFTDLMISEYGDYILRFTSSYAHSVLSQKFKVRYVNDYTPQFIPNNASRTKNVSEAAPIGTSILTIKATDNDQGSQGDVAYSIRSGNVGNAFSIDKSSGLITTNTTLDREATYTYSLIIRASDKAVPEKVKFAETKVVVMVMDINDNAPTFIDGPFEVSVKETESVNRVITRVKAVDPDAGTNGEVKYSITSGNSRGYFKISEKTGDVYLLKLVDLEGSVRPPLLFTLGILATDLGTPTPRSNTSKIVIKVEAVNEFAPQFTHNTLQPVNIQENLKIASGLEIVDVNATDKDYGVQGQVSYSIISGNQQGCFNIDNTTGIVTLIQSLDYEQSRNYTLVIRATDGGSGGTALHNNVTMVIHVQDINDNKPVFEAPVNQVSIKETLAVGKTAFVVKTTDADSSNNGRLTYKIQTGNEDGFFSLASASGEMKLLKSLDMEVLREMDWNRTLTVIASDHGIPQLSSNVSFTVQVQSVNEYSPVFVTKPLSLDRPENTNIGTIIGQVSASDKDYGPDGQIRYTITNGNIERKFRVDALTGDLFINAPLDYEHTTNFRLQIQARDKSINPANQRRSLSHVDVTVIDVNDNKPVFRKTSYYGKVKETASTGSDVIRVQATDRDSGTNGEVQYSILSNNSNGLFTIDSQTGMITTQKTLDLETQNHLQDLIYVLHVDATDKGTPKPLNTTVTVTIEIISVNEFKPELHQAESVYIRLHDTASIGTSVIDINATDGDFGVDGTLTYTIITGNDNKTFIINKHTGHIYVNKPLNYHALPRYFLVVNVTDGAPYGVRHSVVAKVTVRLTNAEDSGGTDIRVVNLTHRITCPGNIAKAVGINTSSYFSIELLSEVGKTSEILDINDKRVTLDDKTLSRGLFYVAKQNNKWIVQLNKTCRLGDGILVVRVQGVYSFHVQVSVVGYSSLMVLVTSQQRLMPDKTLSSIESFSRIGGQTGSFERANLHLHMKLTDNSTYDVTKSKSTSFHLTNNDVNVKVKLGPVPRNRLVIDRMTSYGQFGVHGTFDNLTSPRVVLRTLNKFISPVEILSVDIPGLVNSTLLGVASTTTRVLVTILMDDSSIISIDDFGEFSGLVQFTCNPGTGAFVSPNGIITLRQDSWYSEQLTVTNSHMTTDYQSVDFYCNTEPLPGGVDIGNRTGSPITSYNTPIPIHINTTGFTLLAYNITISYDQTRLKFNGIKNNIPYDVRDGHVTLINVIGSDERNHGYVTDLMFSTTGNVIGMSLLNVTSSSVIDYALTVYPDSAPVRCSPSKDLGDVDGCGGFNIYDAALTMLCATSSQNRRCKDIKDTKKHEMDFNKNGVIEESDAVLLARAAVNQVLFIKTLEILKPDHRNKTAQCVFSIRTSLAKKDGTPVQKHDTQVYFELASNQSFINSQLVNTVFTKGGIIKRYDGRGGLWGGIVQSEFTEDGFFKLESVESQLELQDVGISMVQVTQHAPRGLPISVVPLFSSSRDPLYSTAVDVSLASNTRLLATKGHSPQLLVNLDESTSSCRNPVISKTITVTFKNEFTSIQDKHDIFKSALLTDLNARYHNISITKIRLSPGSIRVDFLASARSAVLESFLDSLWRLLQSGYSLTVHGTTFLADTNLLVDGVEYHSPDTATTTNKFPLTIVVSVCVAIVILSALIGLFVYHRNRRNHGNSRWMKIKKMTKMESRSSLRPFEPPQEQEMTFIGSHLEISDDERSVDYTHMPGTPVTARVSMTTRPESAMSRDSTEAWSEDGHVTPSTPPKKKRLGRLVSANGKVSPAPSAKKPSTPSHKVVTKQNSNSKLINEDSDSDASAPSSPEEPEANNNAEAKTPTINFNVAKALLEHDATSSRRAAGLANGRRQYSASKEPLKRHSSDSRLKELRNEMDNAMLFTRPKLHKKTTWTAVTQASPEYTLPGSTESSPPYSGSTTPKRDRQLVTPSNVATTLQDDLTVQDEPFTVRLPVNVLNTAQDTKAVGPFTKLGFVEVQSDSTLSGLRQLLINRFDLDDQHFVFEDAQMMDVEPSEEDNIIVGEIFTLSVIIKRIAHHDEIKRLFCICNKVAQFQCSSCYQQGYCGRDCQIKDWVEHRKSCTHNSVSVV